MVARGVKYFIRTEAMYAEDQEAKELEALIDGI